MRVSIVMSNAPPRADAFLPGLTRPGLVATRGLVRVYGDPGQMGIFSPPPGLPNPSFDPRFPDSANSPDMILPNVYVSETTNMGPFAARGAAHIRLSDNELPVAAPQPIPQSPQPVTRAARIGGQKVWPNPRVISKWERMTNGAC